MLRLIVVCALVLTAGLAAAAPPSVREAGDRLVFANNRLELQFDRATGAWVGLSEKASGANLIGHCPLRTPVDFQANGQNVCSANAPVPTNAPVRDLAGQWRFRVDPEGAGEKAGWSQGLPDSAEARQLVVPGYWEPQGVTQVLPTSPEPTWVPYNGDAWYEREADVPAEWRGSDLQFSAGAIDDFDWVYCNGERIGHTGEDTPNWWAARRLYTIPARLVKFGAKNRLVVHVFDRGGDGGLLGPVMIGPQGKLPETSRWAPCGLKYLSHSLDGNTLTVVTRAGDWQVTMTYELLPDRSVLRRTMRLKWEGQGPARLGRTQWLVPGVRIGAAADCEIRGQQWDQPVTRFTPGTEPGAPPAFTSPGVTHQDSIWGGGPWSAVYNRKLKRALVVSFIARTEGFSGWAREGEGEASLGSNLDTTDLAQPGQEYDLGTQYVSLRSGEWSDCLTAVRDMYKLHGFVARPNAPTWANRAIIYTMYPGGTMESGLRDTGGFQNVTRYTLPRLKALGINTLWFLPICPGLYGPKDYYAIDPRLGTEDDLRACVAAAKTQGINVLLDLVPHGPATSSPIGTEYPDWVGKDEQGNPALWWGCTYCDYANRGWQQYMADLARYFVEKDGIKGWRVDCAPGGPANWDPKRQVRASMSHMYGGLELMKAAKESMRQVDRDVVLLPEGTGPMLLENSEIVYDYTLYFTILKHFTDAASPGEWAKRTAMWLEQQQLSWPEGACFGLMRFLENHDNVRYWRYAGVGPARALMAMCAWIQGVPLYHHLQEVGSSDLFTRVNALRTQVQELNTGTARYLAAKADKPGVFTCLREDGDRKALVLINLTGETVPTTVSLPADALPRGEKLVAYEALAGQYLNSGGAKGTARATLRQLKASLAPYQPALVLLRPVGAKLPLLPATPAPRALTPASPAVRTDAAGASLTVGGLGLDVAAARGGLPTALTLGGTNLLVSAELAEGQSKPLGPGRGLSLAEAGQATVTSATTPTPQVTVRGNVLRGKLGGTELRLPYQLTYTAQGADTVQVTVGFQMPQTLTRTTGTLRLELAFQNADRWAVDTLEGRLEDAVTCFHPVPGDYLSGWLRHVTGDRLWENATLPLDPRHPQIGLRCAASGQWLTLSSFTATPGLPLDNLYLRETRGADRKQLGPTLVLAWLDNKGPYDLLAGQWYTLGFSLTAGTRPPPPASPLPNLRTEGGNYVLENSHYRLIVGKSGGGVIRSFTSRRTGWRAITGSDTYTDNGFYEKASNEGGQYGSAADWPDLDPEVICRREGDKTVLEITGKLHSSNWNWAFTASPNIAYRKTFVCDGSDTVHCEVALRPFARSQMKGFLAHRLLLPAMAAWLATGQDQLCSGIPGGPNTRTWQSRASSFRDHDAALAFTGAGGESLLLSHLNMSPKPQNVFIHQSGAAPNLFLAWYDFDPVDVPPTWHTLSYDLRIVPGGATAVRKLVEP